MTDYRGKRGGGAGMKRAGSGELHNRAVSNSQVQQAKKSNGPLREKVCSFLESQSKFLRLETL